MTRREAVDAAEACRLLGGITRQKLWDLTRGDNPKLAFYRVGRRKVFDPVLHIGKYLASCERNREIA